MNRKIFLILLMVSLAALSGKASGEEILYTSLDEAVLSKSVECEAIYWNWFAVRVKVVQKSSFVKGIRIDIGTLFENQTRTASRLCVQEVKAPFKNGKIDVIVKVVAMTEGYLKGKEKEQLLVSRKRMVLSHYKKKVCQELDKIEKCRTETIQIAIWMEDEDPEMMALGRWRVTPGLTPLFGYADGYTALFIARRNGLDIYKKKLYKDECMLLRGLKDEKYADFCVEVMRKLGYKATTPVNMAEEVFKKLDFITVTYAATALLYYGRPAPIRKVVLEGEVGWTRTRLIDIYIMSEPREECFEIMVKLLKESYGGFCSCGANFLKRCKFSEYELKFARILLDMGAKEDLRVKNIKEARAAAAGCFFRQKDNGVVKDLIRMVQTDPDWSIRLGCAKSLDYRHCKEALPILKQLLPQVPSQYVQRWKLFIKGIEDYDESKAKPTPKPTPTPGKTTEPSKEPGDEPVRPW